MIMTLNCDGTSVIPVGTLVLFCSAGLSHLVAGIPPVKTLVEPIVFLAGPIIMPEAT